MLRTSYRKTSLALLFIISFTILVAHADPPPYDLRPPGEFEPHEAMILAWYYLASYGAEADTMWARAVEALREVATVHISVQNNSRISPIQNFLTSLGISLDNVQFIATSTMNGGGVWVRDYGPEFVYKENGERIIVEGGYNPAYNDVIANLWGVEHYHVPLSLQGGNFMSDGAREVAVSSRYVNDPDNWQETVREHYDLPLHLVPYLQDEQTGHIDMFTRFVAPDKVIVATYANPSHDANLDLAASEFEQMGYQVFRILSPPMLNTRVPMDALAEPSMLHLSPGSKAPSDGRLNVFRSYTNGIQCNGIYILPVYDHPFDDLAVETFQAALPDHEIVPINCNQIIQYLGALHCTSSDIYAMAPSRPEPLAVSAVGDDVVLAWPPVTGVAMFEVFRRVNTFSFEVHLNDYVGSVAGTTWTDSGVLDDSGPFVYQVLSVGNDGTRSVLSPRGGAERYITMVGR